MHGESPSSESRHSDVRPAERDDALHSDRRVGERRFQELMSQVREGSDVAAEALLQEYGKYVLRAVRRRLPPVMRSRYDSCDFTQAVWASFFGNLTEVCEFQSPQAFVAFLTRVASNKVVDEGRRQMTTQRRDVRRERSLNNAAAMATNELLANDPTASQWAMANEQWRRLLESETGVNREIIELRMHGVAHKDIAERLGIHERTVRRILRRTLDRLET